MTTSEKFLLAQRKDGKFLRIIRTFGSTSEEFIDDPVLADRRTASSEDEFKNPKLPNYYFEEKFIEDCVMVPYEITTEIKKMPFDIKTAKWYKAYDHMTEYEKLISDAAKAWMKDTKEARYNSMKKFEEMAEKLLKEQVENQPCLSFDEILKRDMDD